MTGSLSHGDATEGEWVPKERVGMCSRVTCRTCDKPTWQGCGLHIEQALDGVPTAERCQCRENTVVTKRPGLVARFFGR